MTSCGRSWKRTSKEQTKKKRLSQVETPSPLLKLCFQTMWKYDVAKVLLVPFRLKKTDSTVNTEIADDTISVFSFDDPIDTTGLLGLLDGYPSQTSSPVIQMVATGGTGDPQELSNAVSVYHHVGLQELFHQVEMHMLLSRGFIINPLLDEILFNMNNPGMCLLNTFHLRSLPEVKAITEVIASLCATCITVHGSLPSLTTCTNPKPSSKESVTCNSSLDSTCSVLKTDDESDDSLVEVYYHLPTALNDTPAKDICYLEQNTKFMNLLI